MNNIAVSVIIPIYNAERHLEECLNSCIEQTLNRIEIICVNDGSTDNTDQLLDIYAQKYSNIVILNQKNQGPGVARNLGLKYANGEFVAFMDSDDYYPDKDSLKKLYEAAVREHVLVCGGSAFYIDNGEINKSNTIWCFNKECKMHFKEYQALFGGYTRFIYNMEFLKKNEINFPAYRRYQDPPFFAEVMTKVNEFYAISDWIYAIRNTDKVVRYNNKNLLLDALNGIKDVLKISRTNRFVVLHANTVFDLTERFMAYVYKSIYRGNKDVRNFIESVLAEVDKALLEQDNRKIRMPELMSDEEICQMIDSNIKREQELLNKISSYEILLIYGAGSMGRIFYNYLKQRDCNIDVEFVVSAENPQYTSCGKQVHSLREYVNVNNRALVVIANKNDAEQMEKNARSYQFKHIAVVSYDELMFFGVDLIDESRLIIY